MFLLHKLLYKKQFYFSFIAKINNFYNFILICFIPLFKLVVLINLFKSKSYICLFTFLIKMTQVKYLIEEVSKYYLFSFLNLLNENFNLKIELSYI